MEQTIDLNPRQQRLVAGIASGKSGTKAAIDAGYSPVSARQTASRVLNSPEARSAMQQALTAAGVTPERLAEKFADLLDVSQFALNREGVPVELGPDGHTQSRALELAAKIYDVFPSTKVDAQVVSGAVVIRGTESLTCDPFESERELYELTAAP